MIGLYSTYPYTHRVYNAWLQTNTVSQKKKIENGGLYISRKLFCWYWWSRLLPMSSDTVVSSIITCKCCSYSLSFVQFFLKMNGCFPFYVCVCFFILIWLKYLDDSQAITTSFSFCSYSSIERARSGAMARGYWLWNHWSMNKCTFYQKYLHMYCICIIVSSNVLIFISKLIYIEKHCIRCRSIEMLKMVNNQIILSI